MSWYPDPRYLADAGEVSATFRPASAKAEVISTTGGAFHFLATGDTTDRQFGFYRVDMGPEPGGTSTHFHRTIAEALYILSGTVRVYDGSRWVDATAGDFLYAPAGALHAFRNESGEPASLLNLFTPGAAREGYFHDIAGLANMSPEERNAFFVEHDSFFVDQAGGPSGAFTEPRR